MIASQFVQPRFSIASPKTLQSRSIVRRAFAPLLLVLLLVTMAVPSARAQGGPTQLQPRDPSQPVMDRLEQPRLEIETDRFLSVNLFGIEPDAQKIAQVAAYRIVSPDDARYSADKQVQPVTITWRSRTGRVALREPNTLVKYTVLFLELPQPLKPGCIYNVTMNGATEAPVTLQPVKFDDRALVNDNIRVNQLGYLPGQPKRAYVGQYRGDGGAMPMNLGEFSLIDTATGKSVFTAKAARREVNEKLVGQEVWELDFTAFNQTGTYRLHIPSMGVSYPFMISPTALSPLSTLLMLGHYHQRCANAIEAPYSRFSRIACHLDDAFLDAESSKTKFVAPKKPPLYPQPEDGRRQPATRGHHDAGDYGKYSCTGAEYVFSTLLAMDKFADKFRQDNFGLPWSGNGIPDLLEEAKWEIDWFENMQDPEDGGVYGVIRPRSGGYEHAMAPAESRRLFFPKDTIFTAAYAGSLAYASMSPTMQKYFPQDSKRYLQKAIKAWEFLEKNSRYVEYFHYGSVFGDWDERCWAAASLYAATGEQKYHDYFLKNFRPEEKRWGWQAMFEAVGNAVLTYNFAGDKPRDPAMLERCRKALIDTARTQVKEAQDNPYRLSMPSETLRFGRYGWYFPGALVSWHMIWAWSLEKDPVYLQTALDQMNYTCGGNPQGYFLYTGLGHKRNNECVDEESRYDGINEPVSGIPLGIGSDGFYWINEFGPRLGKTTYPGNGDWPLLHRWYDGFNVQSEFTMGPMMKETLVAAFFDGPRADKPQRPTVKIIADKTSGPPPLNIQFKAQVQAAGAVRFVFWDFDDQTFSTALQGSRTYSTPGAHHRIAVTIMDDQGISAFDEVDVWVDQPTPFSRVPLQADANTIALFKFDGDLKDAGPNKLELKVMPNRKDEKMGYSFSKSAPRWLEKPQGNALVLDGAEHFTVAIPRKELPEFPSTPLKIEMMLYLESFNGYGYKTNPDVLALRMTNDLWLGLQQNTWDKVGAPRFASTAGEGLSSAKVNELIPRSRWCHVVLQYDGRDTAKFFVDGQELGKITGRFFRNDPQPLMFSFGPIKGMIDDLKITRGN